MKFVYRNIRNSIVSLLLVMFVSYSAYADDCESLGDSVPHSCNACLTFNSCVAEAVFMWPDLYGQQDAIVNACLDHIQTYYTGMNQGASWVDQLVNIDGPYNFFATFQELGYHMYYQLNDNNFTTDEYRIVYGDHVKNIAYTNLNTCIGAGYCGFDTCTDRFGANYTAVPDIGKNRTVYINTSSGSYNVVVERFGSHVKCCKCPDDGVYDSALGVVGTAAFGYIGCTKENEEPFSDTTGSGVNSGQCYYSLTSDDLIIGLF